MCTIAVQSELPTITEAVVIDGETQAGADCGSGIPSRTLKIVVDGSAIGVSVNGFTVTGSGSTIRALVINQFQVIGTFQSGGIVLTGSGSVDNVIACNFIGTDVTGTLAQGNNLAGVLVDLGASNNTIGGTTPDAGNLISGNFTGVHITGSGTTGNRVQGNYIGTDAGGTIDLGNYTGVTINTASNNTIGGTVAGARNVISGNNDGVLITGNGTTGHQVQGNYIGTDAGGTIDLGNTQSGVVIVGSAANTIGGTAAGARNVISGNNIGVVIKHSGSTGNQVQGNYIGTDASGTADLGNTQSGVVINISAANNTIGGTAAGAANTIAFNGQDGVALESGTGNAILSNSIFENMGIGIDLGTDGPTPNDPGDSDASPNNLQNFPDLTDALIDNNGDLLLFFFVDTDLANATYPLTTEFFEADADDEEGQAFLGRDAYATTDHDGCGARPARKSLIWATPPPSV